MTSEMANNFGSKIDSVKFSILVPVYNSEKTIKRCLDSALSQTYDNVEIIAVDDASVDESYRILNEYKKTNAEIVTIKREVNSSLLSARIAAMQKASGDYVLFLDSDDYIENDTCQVLSDEIKHKRTDIVEFSYISEPDKKVFINKKKYEDNKTNVSNILTQNYPHTVWNKCYSKYLIDKVLNNAEDFYCNMTEDVYFSVLFFYYSRSYRRIKNVLYHYSVDGGMSNAKEMSKNSIDNIYLSIANKDEYLRSFFNKNNPELLNLVDTKKTLDIKMMAKLCCSSKNMSVEERIKLIEYFDIKFGTEYSKVFDKELTNAYENYEYLNNVRKREGLIFILKKCIIYLLK